MKHASQILACNILALFEESSRSAKEVGQSSGVGQTTISGWIRKARESDPNFNPRVDQLEALARTFGHTVGDLFTENLGRNKKEAAGPSVAAEAASAAAASLSPAARAVIERICAVEGAGASSPQLLQAIEAVLDLAHPRASAGGYPGLDNLHAE